MPPLAALQWSLQELWPLALLPLAAGAAFLGYRRTTPPLSRAARLPLVGLRALSAMLLVLVLASPVLVRSRPVAQEARVAVLVDESASMSSADTPGGPTRYVRARAEGGRIPCAAALKLAEAEKMTTAEAADRVAEERMDQVRYLHRTELGCADYASCG